MSSAATNSHALLHQIGHRFLGAEHASEGILAAGYSARGMRAHGNEPRLGVRDVVLLGASIVSRLEGPGAFEHERIVSVDPRGNIVRIVDGQARQAVIRHAFAAELDVPGADLSVVHNHGRHQLQR